MNINLSAPKGDLTAEMKTLVAQKLDADLEEHLEPFEDDLKVADVVIEKHPRWGYEVSFTMTLPGKKKVYSDTRDEDLTVAITDVRDEVLSQIQEYRGKLAKGAQASN